MKLTKDEQRIFCKVALKIAQKGHLTKEALVRFSLPKHERKNGKHIVEKFYNPGLLKKHRTDTYELSKIGRLIAMGLCERLRWKYR